MAKTLYVALLRGINVGGKNKIQMSALKRSFENRGFENVSTYINSGNVLFTSSEPANKLQEICTSLIKEDFALAISVCVISAKEMAVAVGNAPDWWGEDKAWKHNAIFVLFPKTAGEVAEEVGLHLPAFEKVAFHGQVIFWSASLDKFSQTRWSNVVKQKEMYQLITIRNANTVKKLLELSKKEEKECL